MAVSALRYAMSSCEGLAVRHERHLGAAQAELRRAGQAWADSKPAISLYLSRVTIAEIRYGIERLPTADRLRKRLEAWVANELRPWFADHLLDVDEDVFAVWRRLVEKGKAVRHTFPQPDLFITATAVLHDLCVVTRNAADFLMTGAPVLNPWTDTEPQPTE
jgi:predicted nucleic acid-binding protein